MRKLHLVLALLLAALVLPGLTSTSFAAKPGKGKRDPAAVRAILIHASNKKGGVDRKLAMYEAELRRNLPFDTFRVEGEGNTIVADGGQATLVLSHGYRLEISDEAGEGLRLKVKWMKGSEVVISTNLELIPGTPGVLVRRGANDGDVPVILLIAR